MPFSWPSYKESLWGLTCFWSQPQMSIRRTWLHFLSKDVTAWYQQHSIYRILNRFKQPTQLLNTEQMLMLMCIILLRLTKYGHLDSLSSDTLMYVYCGSCEKFNWNNYKELKKHSLHVSGGTQTDMSGG